MAWRLPSSRFEAQKGEPNRKALEKLVCSGKPVGLLGYLGAEPVAWCSVAPREDFIRLQSARSLKPIDDQPVWSVVCLFVLKPYRRHGLSTQMLQAAVTYCRKEGARIVEGYPTEPSRDLPDPFVWTGLVSAFRRAGFTEVARPSKTRAIMRYTIS